MGRKLRKVLNQSTKWDRKLIGSGKRQGSHVEVIGWRFGNTSDKEVDLTGESKGTSFNQELQVDPPVEEVRQKE